MHLDVKVDYALVDTWAHENTLGIVVHQSFTLYIRISTTAYLINTIPFFKLIN